MDSHYQDMNAEPKTKRPDRYRKIEMEWSAEQTIQLIRDVHQFEGLWNVASSLYKDRELRSKNWISVAGALGIGTDQCKVKWNSLRTSFQVSTQVCLKYLSNTTIARMFYIQIIIYKHATIHDIVKYYISD